MRHKKFSQSTGKKKFSRVHMQLFKFNLQENVLDAAIRTKYISLLNIYNLSMYD